MSTRTSSVEEPAAGARRGGGDDLFSRERQVYEPHRAGLPPMRAYLREVWRRREFARELSRSNLRAQHFNTVFGLLWLVINPLLLAAVYFVLVDILRGGDSGPEFLGHLVACIFAYYFIQQALRTGVKSVTSGGRLILNTAFPRLLLPIASLTTAFSRFLPTLVIYIPIHVLTGLPFTWQMLWLVPIVGLLVGVAFGLTTLVGVGQVYFRDLRSFLPYATRLWLYTSPILYYASEVPDKYRFLLYANPLGSILTAWSDVLRFGRAPDATDLLVGLAWAAGLMTVGVLLFVSREREFAVRL